MIAFIEGTIEKKSEREVVVSSGSIGWKIFVSQETLRYLPAAGKSVKLWTSFYLKQGGTAELYGFLNESDQVFFELLNSVAGVGPKSALAVLGLAPAEKIRSAIASGDASLLTRVSGIGRKTAERIIVELRSKIHAAEYDWQMLSADIDAIEALTKLGYSKEEARRALEKVSQEIVRIEERVKEALRILGSGIRK